MLDNTLKALDFTNDAKIAAKAASFATKTEGKVNTLLASLFYFAGLADFEAKRNEPRNLKPLLDAFAAKHYTGGDDGRKPLAKGTLEAYTTCFGMYYAVGNLPYDGSSIANFAMDTLTGSFTKRGAILRSIVTAYPKDCPTVEQMQALVPAKTEKTLREKAAKLRKDTEDLAAEFAGYLVAYPKADLAFADAVATLDLAVRSLPVDATDGPDYTARAEAKRKALVSK